MYQKIVMYLIYRLFTDTFTDSERIFMKIVIVGGVAGGATAAARIRRLDEQAQIIVFERSGYL